MFRQPESRKLSVVTKSCPPYWRYQAKFVYLGLLLSHYQITNSWHLLRNLLQLSPVHQNRLDLLNLGASSIGVTNCQCLSEEEKKSRRHLPAQKKSRRHLPAQKRRGLSTYLYSIRRFVYLSLSISQSKSISHEVIRRRWIESTKLVLTLPKIHLKPCQAGCLWGCLSNACIHQERMYSGHWSLLLIARLTQLKSLDRLAFNCWTKSSN